MTRPRTVILLLVLAGFAAASAAQDCYEYRNTFHVADPFPLTGSVTAMAGDQDRVLAVRGYDLVFLDVADPQAVMLLGTLTLGEAPLQVASSGYLAAVASDNSLMLVDWSDPTDARVTVATSLPSGTRSLWRQGDVLLVCRGSAGVELVDVSDPYSFGFRGNVPTPGAALEAVLHQGWLVVADSSALLSVDVSDPGAPAIVDTYTDYQVSAGARDVRRVQSDGPYLVAAAIRWHGGQYGGPTEGLDRLTVDPSGQLSLEASMYYYGWPEYVAAGGLLHTSDNQAYTVAPLVDFPDVAAGHEPPSPAAGIMAVGAGTVLHRLSAGQLGVYDARYPFYLQPDPAWSGPAFHDVPRGQVVPGWVLKTRTVWSGMVFSYYAYLYDVRDPQAVVELEDWSFSGYSDDWASASICAGDAKRVVMNVGTTDGGGCRLSDLRTGTEIVTWLPYSGTAVMAGNRIYQKTAYYDAVDGLACLDISTPGVVTEIGFRPGELYGPLLALDENTILIQEGGLQVVDFTDPAQPADRGALPGVTGQYLARQDDRLYLTHDSGRLAAVDLADLDGPWLVWDSASLGGGISALALSGDQAAVAISAFEGQWVRTYDLGNDFTGPAALSPAFAAGTYQHGLLWDGDVLYTGDLRVYAMDDPAAPVELGRGTGAQSDLYRHGDSIVTSSGVFPVQCVVTGVEDPGAIPEPAAGLAMQVAPNPFNPRTTVSFVVPAGGEVSLSLYDLAGRRVRALLHATVVAGRHEVSWDGRDDRGRAQSSGVYFARLEAGARRETAKLVLVR